MKTWCMQMETTGGHKNVALMPWRNKRDKKVQNKVIARISVFYILPMYVHCV